MWLRPVPPLRSASSAATDLSSRSTLAVRQDAPKQGGTLRLALAHEPDSLDPHYLLTTEAFRIVEQLYSSLVSLDKDMNIIPDVAEWTISPDATKFDFKIRGASCSIMEEIEAADVEYTARRLADGSPYEYIFRDLDTITVRIALDDYVHLQATSCALLSSHGPALDRHRREGDRRGSRPRRDEDQRQRRRSVHSLSSGIRSSRSSSPATITTGNRHCPTWMRSSGRRSKTR